MAQNPIDEKVDQLKSDIIEKVNRLGVYKKSSCDCPQFGWDLMEHNALHHIFRTNGIKGVLISHDVNFGVTDWTFTKF